MTGMIFLFLAVLVIIAIVIISHLRIVPEAQAHVMERFGVYSRTWQTGLHFKVPFVERCAKVVDLREQILVVDDFNHGQYRNRSDKALDFKKFVGKVEGNNEYKSEFNYSQKGIERQYAPQRSSQPVITKDNVSIEVDTVVFFQITDAKRFAYGHVDPIAAIRHIASTTLRNLIGELELDETLTSRDLINAKLRAVLDEATDAWGVKVTRVELKNIMISDKELAEAMEKQMIAERIRRATVIEAEGYKRSEILKAEGDKQAVILAAEAAKQAKILEAEGVREADICEGEGEAERILLVQQATAEGLKMINAAAPTAEAQNIYLGVKSLEALEEAAKGEATTIIIPSEVQSLAGLAKSAAEVFKA